jgi:hypothetical protein
MFPDGKSALVYLQTLSDSGPTGFKQIEYYFDSGIIEDIEPQIAWIDTYPDPYQNQLIGIYNEIINFVKHDNDIQRLKPEIDEGFKYTNRAVDVENGILWSAYINTTSKDLLLVNVSTKSCSVIDSFRLTNYTASSIENLVIDPQQRNIFFIHKITEKKDFYTKEFMIIDLKSKEIVKSITLQINVHYGDLKPCIISIPDKNKVFVWDGYGSWCIDTNSMELEYGIALIAPAASPRSFVMNNIEGVWDSYNEKVIIYDPSVIPGDLIRYYPRVLEINVDNGQVLQEIKIDEYFSKVFFPKEKDKIWFLAEREPRVYTLHLNPAWNESVKITPTSNYINYTSGTRAIFRVNVQNPYTFEQKATAFIWLYAPDIDTPFYFDGVSLTTEAKGIPLTLPANLDVTGDIMTFTMPSGVPEGYYNFNAVFINENGDRGPIGTWNFYVKD